jgi:hypothetical protein
MSIQIRMDCSTLRLEMAREIYLVHGWACKTKYAVQYYSIVSIYYKKLAK